MWLYDGAPEHVELSVRDAQPEEGGYVVLLVLESGEMRLLGTRIPGKYVANWGNNAVRHDGAKLARVIVLGRHPRYEKVKKILLSSLIDVADQQPQQSDSRPGTRLASTLDQLLSKAEMIFKLAPVSNANLAQASKQLAEQA